jgi:hypothetical protein
MRQLLIAAFVLAVGAPTAAAVEQPVVQPVIADADAVQRLTMTDGARVYGRVETILDHEIRFVTLAGIVLTIDRDRIADLRIVQGRVVNGEFRRQDPHSSRLAIGPTARSLRRGEGYITLHQFLMPSMQVGLTDRVSVGAATPLYFFGERHPFLLTPKVQVLSRENVKVAAGTIHLMNVGGDRSGLVYGVTTLGSIDNAATIALGYAFRGHERRPIVMLGGELRESGRVKWFTENWLFGLDNGFVSGGARILRERFSTELALVVPLGIPYGHPAPMINFAWSF